MLFEKLLLQNHEVLVRDTGSPINRFQLNIPIYRALLRDDITLDPRLANNIFPAAVAAWQHDIQTAKLHSGAKREDIANYFVEYNIIQEEHHNEPHQIVKPWDFYDEVDTTKTGLVRNLRVAGNENVLHFNEDSLNSSMSSKIIMPEADGFSIDFSQEKIDLYSVDPSSRGFLTCHNYGIHNPGSWVMVNLLRIWAIQYLNAAMTQLHERGILTEQNLLTSSSKPLP
jgi:hypothetical protein